MSHSVMRIIPTPIAARQQRSARVAARGRSPAAWRPEQEPQLMAHCGLRLHLSESGSFDERMRATFLVAVVTRTIPGTIEAVLVVDLLCLPLDLLANRMCLPEANLGDLVMIFQLGAYRFKASPLDLLKSRTSAEVLV
ncbi:MAG: hypothetical protein J0M13_13320 [Candidatus Accumulibacter sp.]|nr:hypothetical protein [Candidatus Accumulibacter necessarius]